MTPPGYNLFPYTTLFRSDLVFGGRLLGEDAAAERDGDAFPGLDAVGADDMRSGPRLVVVFCVGPTGRCFGGREPGLVADRKSTRLNSSHMSISYAVFCLK